MSLLVFLLECLCWAIWHQLFQKRYELLIWQKKKNTQWRITALKFSWKLWESETNLWLAQMPQGALPGNHSSECVSLGERTQWEQWVAPSEPPHPGPAAQLLLSISVSAVLLVSLHVGFVFWLSVSYSKAHFCADSCNFINCLRPSKWVSIMSYTLLKCFSFY